MARETGWYSPRGGDSVTSAAARARLLPDPHLPQEGRAQSDLGSGVVSRAWWSGLFAPEQAGWPRQWKDAQDGLSPPPAIFSSELGTGVGDIFPFAAWGWAGVGGMGTPRSSPLLTCATGVLCPIPPNWRGPRCAEPSLPLKRPSHPFEFPLGATLRKG